VPCWEGWVLQLQWKGTAGKVRMDSVYGNCRQLNWYPGNCPWGSIRNLLSKMPLVAPLLLVLLLLVLLLVLLLLVLLLGPVVLAKMGLGQEPLLGWLLQKKVVAWEQDHTAWQVAALCRRFQPALGPHLVVLACCLDSTSLTRLMVLLLLLLLMLLMLLQAHGQRQQWVLLRLLPQLS